MGPHISCWLKESPDGIPSCLRSPEGISYFAILEVVRWDLIFHVCYKESPNGIPSCLRSLEGISYFAILEVARWDLIFHVC